MAYNKKTGPEIPKVGSLSGWNRITTQDIEGNTPLGDHQFTIPDLVALLRALREEFNPLRLAEIEELIRRHDSRKDNPHQDDLEKLHTSVLQELYKLWLEEGNTGTADEFLKVLFQFTKIADIETTREGTALDEVVSARGLKVVVDDHDQDPYAHDELFSRLFPGTPVKAFPSYSIIGELGLPANAIVRRDGPMTIIDHNGMVKELPANTLEPDYSIGLGCLPIFGELTNYVEDSENFGHTNYWLKNNATLSTTTGIQSMRDYTSDAWVIREVATPAPTTHGIVYNRESINITEGEYYTVSVFVSPMGRKCFGIEIMDSIDAEGRFGYKDSGLLPFDQGTFLGTTIGMYRCVHFDLEKGEVFINSESIDLSGHIYPLYNGWYRVQMTFKALRSVPFAFHMYTLDIHDGDGTHEGVTGLGVAVFGAMVTRGPFIPPYIPSIDGVMGKLKATTVEIPLDDWYRRDAGTVVALFNNNAINARLNTNSEIYNIGKGAASVASLARLPVGHDDRAYMVHYGVNNAVLASKWSKATQKEWMTLCQGYSLNRHLFGNSDGSSSEVQTTKPMNDVCDTLYLGCDRRLASQLNGFLREWTYYPECLEPGNVEFFVGR